jgi:hypothetical protein
MLRMVVVWGVGGATAGDSGAMFFTSLLLIIVKGFAIFSFVVQHISICLANYFSISWSLSMSIVKGMMVL